MNYTPISVLSEEEANNVYSYIRDMVILHEEEYDSGMLVIAKDEEEQAHYLFVLDAMEFFTGTAMEISV